MVECAGQCLEWVCWKPEGDPAAASTWHTFFHTEDGERVLVAAFAKLRAMPPGDLDVSGTSLVTQVVAFVCDDELGDAAWQAATECLEERVGRRFTGAGSDRKSTVAAVREWWSTEARKK